MSNVCRSRGFGVSGIGFHGGRSRGEIIFKVVLFFDWAKWYGHTGDGRKG